MFMKQRHLALQDGMSLKHNHLVWRLRPSAPGARGGWGGKLGEEPDARISLAAWKSSSSRAGTRNELSACANLVLGLGYARSQARRVEGRSERSPRSKKLVYLKKNHYALVHKGATAAPETPDAAFLRCAPEIAQPGEWPLDRAPRRLRLVVPDVRWRAPISTSSFRPGWHGFSPARRPRGSACAAVHQGLKGAGGWKAALFRLRSARRRPSWANSTWAPLTTT